MTPKEAEQKVAEWFARKEALAIQHKKGIDGNQPFDITVISRDLIWCVDVKHCETTTFPLSRVEENQKSSMGFLHNTVCNPSVKIGFIIVYENKMYWYDYKIYYHHANILEKKSVNVKTLPFMGELK